MLKDKLEIILVTYNRKNNLERTFDQIFAENSPIKDLQITILNNKSDDGTTELIEEYRKKFPNIKHIIHNRNIGGNGNIARAFEIAQKKYFWILCDDDKYNWDGFEEVEKAIEEDYDAIVVANYLNPAKSPSQLLKQLTFVPAGIYKTENITDTVMNNIIYCQSLMFGQLSVGCHLINENKRIYICKDWFVEMQRNDGEDSFIRGLEDNIHPYRKFSIWECGFVNTIQLIKDKKLKKQLIENCSVAGESFPDAIHSIIAYNFTLCRQYKIKCIRNLSDFWNALSFSQRLVYVHALSIFWFKRRTKRIVKDIRKLIYGKERVNNGEV